MQQGFRQNNFFLPPVVKNLLIINGLMYLATTIFEINFHDELSTLLGLHYWKSEYFSYYQFFTYSFLHGNFTHLFFNMFALWMFGVVLENAWGAKKFLTYYIITCLGAAVVYLLYSWWDFYGMNQIITDFRNNPSVEIFQYFTTKYIPFENLNPEYKIKIDDLIAGWTDNPDITSYQNDALFFMNDFVKFKSNIPVVGASGGVFGVLLAFGMLFPNTELFLMFIPIPIKAKYFVIIYGAVELFMGIQNNPTDNVAHFAHLGGMLFGFILIKYWQKNRNKF
jgi:membrane associated rhomboid family serine protease